MTEKHAENEGPGVSTQTDAQPIAMTPEFAPTKSKLPTALLAVAGVVIAALLVGVGLLGWGYLNDRAAEQARTDAVAAAKVQAAAMMSYNFNDVDQQLVAAGESLMGSFKADYDQLMKETIAPGAKEKKLTTEATVQAGAVQSASKNDAVVLIYVNQITRSEEMPDAATTGSRVLMTMHKEGDRWLVADLKSV